MSKKKNNSQKVGICRLTKIRGEYVKSHLIPKALTKPKTAGKPFIQVEGYKTTRRWNSWYDTELVTTEGEKILADLDTWGIAELRKHKLIWSSWDKDCLWTQIDPIGSEDNNPPIWARNITQSNPKKLRLFFLVFYGELRLLSAQNFQTLKFQERILSALDT